MTRKTDYPAPFYFISHVEFLMFSKGLNRSELAKKSGISPIYISYILNGKRNPSDEMVIKIAKALEVDPPESLLISIGRIPPDRTDLQELLREAYKLTGFGVLELRDDAVRKQGEKGARNLINKFLYRGVK